MSACCPCCGQAIRARAPLRLQQVRDQYGWDVNGVATVWDFAGDPDFQGKRTADRFGYYIAGDEWVTGFTTKEEAGEAALNKIWNAYP